MSQVIKRPVTPEQQRARDDKKRARDAEERLLEQDLIIAFLLDQLVDKEDVDNDAH